MLVKAAVSPWDNSLVPVDVFRSPLGRVFSLLEEIRTHVYSDRSEFSIDFDRSFITLCYGTFHKSCSLLPDFLNLSQKFGGAVLAGDRPVAGVTAHAGGPSRARLPAGIPWFSKK